MRKERLAGIVSALAVLALFCSPLSAHEPAAKRIAKGTKTLWAAREIKWQAMPGLPGAQQAPLWGDPAKGEHGIIHREGAFDVQGLPPPPAR